MSTIIPRIIQLNYWLFKELKEWNIFLELFSSNFSLNFWFDNIFLLNFPIFTPCSTFFDAVDHLSTFFVAVTPEVWLFRALNTPYATISFTTSKAIKEFTLFFLHRIRPFIQPQKVIVRSKNYDRCYSKIVGRFFENNIGNERPKFDVCIFTYHKHCYFHSKDLSNHLVLWFLLLQGIDPKNKEGRLQEKKTLLKSILLVLYRFLWNNPLTISIQ